MRLRCAYLASTSLLAFSACTKAFDFDELRFACTSDEDCARGRVCDRVTGACAAPGAPADAGPDDTGPADLGHRDATAPDTSADATLDAGADASFDAAPMDAETPDAIALDTGPGVIDLAAGLRHTCALLEGGEVRCWGGNDFGQLGQGAPSLQPMKIWRTVPGLGDVVELEAGAFHTCVRERSGDVRCWGRNALGQCGVDPSVVSVASPGQVIVQGAVDVEIGPGQAVCAVLASGEVLCWGFVIDGQGSFACEDCGTANPIPAPIPALTSTLAVTQIAVGTFNACAIAGDREVHCWGNNEFGQVGAGNIGIVQPTPVPIAIPGPPSLVRLGDSETCMIVEPQLHCWGNWPPHAPARFFDMDAQDVDLGRRHGCALLHNGDVSCWGSTEVGAAGFLPNGAWRVPPGPIEGLLGKRTRVLAAGVEHNCALTDDGEILCWGNNADYQLGRESFSPWTAIAAPIER